MVTLGYGAAKTPKLECFACEAGKWSAGGSDEACTAIAYHTKMESEGNQAWRNAMKKKYEKMHAESKKTAEAVAKKIKKNAAAAVLLKKAEDEARPAAIAFEKTMQMREQSKEREKEMKDGASKTKMAAAMAALTRTPAPVPPTAHPTLEPTRALTEAPTNSPTPLMTGDREKCVAGHFYTTEVIARPSFVPPFKFAMSNTTLCACNAPVGRRRSRSRTAGR